MFHSVFLLQKFCNFSDKLYNVGMIKQKNTFFLGIFILLVWLFFGIPTSWKVFSTILSALYLLVISVKINLPKRGAVKRPRRKEKVTSVFVENSPIFPPAQTSTEPENQTKF
jgi:hypothetical protein